MKIREDEFIIIKIQQLPDDIQVLAELAHNEGFRFIQRLVEDFLSGENRFDADGEALFEVRFIDRLVAIGGLNIDPYSPSGCTGRVRRCYVHPDHRSHGIGQLLLRTIEEHAAKTFQQLHLFTDTDNASLFYQRMGYEVIKGNENASHAKWLRV